MKKHFTQILLLICVQFCILQICALSISGRNSQGILIN